MILAGSGMIFGLLFLLASVFVIWMMIDALVNEPTAGEKLLWFLVILFLHLLGALIYFFVRKQGRVG